MAIFTRKEKEEAKKPSEFSQLRKHLGIKDSKSKAIHAKMGEKKEYTGHYQETATGQVRHQSARQVKAKHLNAD